MNLEQELIVRLFPSQIRCATGQRHRSNTVDLPTTSNTQTGTFSDDTVILVSHEIPKPVSVYLQYHLIGQQNGK